MEEGKNVVDCSRREGGESLLGDGGCDGRVWASTVCGVGTEKGECLGGCCTPYGTHILVFYVMRMVHIWQGIGGGKVILSVVVSREVIMEEREWPAECVLSYWMIDRNGGFIENLRWV